LIDFYYSNLIYKISFEREGEGENFTQIFVGIFNERICINL